MTPVVASLPAAAPAVVPSAFEAFNGAGRISVHSDLLGSFRIRADEVIDFPHGMLGFPRCRRFALVRAGTETLYWLQSLEHRALVFLLTDPFVHFPEYAVDITAPDRADLRAVDPTDLALLAVVTLPTPGLTTKPTANLQGPIAVNFRERTGKQLVCADHEYGVRRELTLPTVGS